MGASSPPERALGHRDKNEGAREGNRYHKQHPSESLAGREVGPLFFMVKEALINVAVRP